VKRLWPLPDGRRVDLNYFVRWRPWLWAKPVANVITFFGDLRGKHVLEIGGRDARMTAFFALLGARVTMIDKHADPEGPAELQKWNVADRVRLIRTAGGFEEIAGERFDAVFTKSVLAVVADRGPFLDALARLLAAGGKVAFIENCHGGRFLQWLRYKVVHRRNFDQWKSRQYVGFTADELDLFRQRFDGVRVHRRLWMVYEIFGHKRPRNDQ
jgi:SAM-dependent methyltransferase